MRHTSASLAALAAFSACLHAQTAKPIHRAASAGAAESPRELPITRVALYKNGVGFFEHTGHVQGDQAVTIDFTSAQLDDVLQSLTAVDLAGGRIAGADFNSATPLDQQLRSLALGLNASTSDVDFYQALRGARVQVSGPGVAITGRILALDLRALPAKEDNHASAPESSRRFLTVVSDAGDVRTFELTGAVQVRLLDTRLHNDVNQYLQLLAGTHADGLRHLTLFDRGSGQRELRVSYISEVPVWKSTYRILFTNSAANAATEATLQGWSVVDNTTGSDWTNVHLDLIAGAPQSFIQPLSTPYYTRRPQIPLPAEAQLTPQTHESGEAQGISGSGIQGTVTDVTGAVISNAQITVTSNNGETVAARATSDAQGNFSANVPPGQYTVTITAPGFRVENQPVSVDGSPAQLEAKLSVGSSSESVTISAATLPTTGRSVMLGKYRNGLGAGAGAGIGGGVFAARKPINYAEAAQASLSPQTTTSAFDDFFEYSLTDPVTIRKNESALVPILQTKLPVERVTLWSPAEPVALRALWITNSSNLTLDRGSFSIVENGSFGGEGLLDPIHPGEKRLLSYAADQAVRVSVDRTSFSRNVIHLKIAKGVLTETSTDVSEVEYLVHNAAPDPRLVLVEQPRQGTDWTLDSEPKPAETTPAAYRFRVATQPGESVRLHIGQRHTNYEAIRLVDRTEEQLRLLLRDAHAGPAMLAALQPVFDLHSQVVALDDQIRAREAEIAAITKDQDRLRENMKALKGTPEERTLLQRYTGELNSQEDRLAVLRTEIADLHTKRTAADADFQNRLEALDLDQAT